MSNAGDKHFVHEHIWVHFEGVKDICGLCQLSRPHESTSEERVEIDADQLFASIDARRRVIEAARRVWVLQSLEDGGVVELHGVYTDLEQAKHALEPKYPNLSVWEPCPDRPDCWRAHTGKHPVLIEPTTLDAATSPEPRLGEEE